MFVLDDPDLEVFNSLPEWLRDKIKENLNYEGSALQKLVGGSAKSERKKGKDDDAEVQKGDPEADAGDPPFDVDDNNPY